jgi:sensor c-di-GMP phosphodiesterase-like protein
VIGKIRALAGLCYLPRLLRRSWKLVESSRELTSKDVRAFRRRLIPRGFLVTAPTPAQIAKRFTAHYQPIVELNTGAIAGFEALARVVRSDGSVTTASTLIDNIERRTDTLKALIRTILSSIRRDIVRLFKRHAHFYVSVNIPPAILGSGQILPMVEELGLCLI